MKKLALTIAIVLGLSMATFANPDEGGLFQRGTTPANESIYGNRELPSLTPGLPGHGSEGNEPAAPLGSGIAVLLGLGAAYMVGKKRREE